MLVLIVYILVYIHRFIPFLLTALKFFIGREYLRLFNTFATGRHSSFWPVRTSSHGPGLSAANSGPWAARDSSLGFSNHHSAPKSRLNFYIRFHDFFAKAKPRVVFV